MRKQQCSMASSIAPPVSLHDIHIVLVRFSAVNVTERAGKELCVSSHGCGTRNRKLFPFELCKVMKNADCWFLRYELLCWTWYSHADSVVKETDHILVSTQKRKLQNSRIFWGAEFFITDN